MCRDISRRRILESGIVGLSVSLAGCGQSTSGPGTTSRTSEDATTSGPAQSDPDSGTSSTPEDLPEDFVERDGTDFTVNGEVFTFGGVANCCLAEGTTSQSRVQDVLDSASSLGANALRFKAGCAGAGSNCNGSVDGCRVCFQPEPGTFDETSFEHLDYIVAEAGKRGIRLVLPLVDNWGGGGMDRYVAWSESASDHDDFYSDQRTQELYRGFVEHLLTRTNSITDREYREDPTILLWELANEPRFEEDYQGFLSWVEGTAGSIHDLDGNHLVSTGSDVYEEETYVEVHSVDGVDACSIHLWPGNWGHSEDAAEFGEEYIQNRVRRGHEDVGKPVYLGEYGWQVNLQSGDRAEQLSRRNELFERWQDAAASVEIDGALAWELLSESRLRYHRDEPGQGETVGFACPQHSRTCEVLRSLFEQMKT